MKLLIIIFAYCNGLWCQGYLWPAPTNTGFGLINFRGEFVVAPNFVFISEENDGMFFFQDSSSFGFLNSSGEIAFRTYSDISHFSEGVSSIKIGEKICFVDKKGDIVIDPVFDNYLLGCSYMCHTYFSEGLAPIIITKRDMPEWHNYIFINKQGRIAINETYTYAQNFSEGLAFVRFSDNSCGYIDHEGVLLIKLHDVQRGGPFSEGFALILDNNYNIYFIDKQGNRLGDLLFSNAESFSDGLAKVTFSRSTLRIWGFINTSGELAIIPQFINATRFSNGLAAVVMMETNSNHHNPNTYIIDKNGMIKYGPFKNTTIRSFKHGLALGTNSVSSDYQTNFYIDTIGKIVWKDSIYMDCTNY
ncbi:MAG: WG repeat-containing protein [Eubacteriales bacterium]